MDKEELDFTDALMLRRIAEEQLKVKQQQSETPVIEADVKKLLHELQVHQIELEMQNEELRHTYETAEAALKKYTMLYDLSPMGYFTLDSDGTICDLNFSGADMLGFKRFSLIERNFKLFVAEKSKIDFNIFFSNLYERNTKESCKIMLAYDQDPLIFVYMEGIVTGDDQRCLLSVVDVSGIV